MNSTTTQPRRASTYDDIRYAANAAMMALRANPHDHEAAAEVNKLRPYLVQHAAVIGQRNQTLNRAEFQLHPSIAGGRMVAANQGLLSGFGDQASGVETAARSPALAYTASAPGLAPAIPSGVLRSQTPDAVDQSAAYMAGRDEYQNYLSEARHNDPIGTTLSDFGGVALQTVAGGKLLHTLVPGLATLGEVATRPPTSFLDLLVKTPARLAAAAVGAAGLGAQASARVAGESDEGHRLRNAALTFPVATMAALPFAAGGVTAGLAGRTALKYMRGSPIPMALRPQEGNVTTIAGEPPVTVRQGPTSPDPVGRPSPPPMIIREPQGSVTMLRPSGGAPPPVVAPGSEFVNPESVIRDALAKKGFSPELIDRAIAARRSVVPPTNPVVEVDKAVGVAQQPGQALHGPSGAVIPGTEVSGMRAPTTEPGSPGSAVQEVLERRGYAPRSATQAQLGYRQGQVASRWLAEAPTPQSAQSVRALFANMPAAEREGAMRTFFTTYAPGRLHPDWVPMIQQLRAMP